MAIVPPYLLPGHTIGLICPAGHMSAEKTEKCIARLQAWGYQVAPGQTIGSQHHYFSGTDKERLADLQGMLDDDSIDAVLCARGGYGISRIIDSINWSRFMQRPKWVIGYSDVTVLHSHLLSNLDVASLHSPMAGAFNDSPESDDYIATLRKALEGGALQYDCLPHPLNRTGEATGVLAGGNLSILAHLTGTPSCCLAQGIILFLEDVGEYLYNIDRMMVQLARAGKIRHLSGLIVGGFTECKNTTPPFGMDAYEIIASHVADFDFPVCFGFPVSHTPKNVPLRHGMPHRLEVTSQGAMLTSMPEG